MKKKTMSKRLTKKDLQERCDYMAKRIEALKEMRVIDNEAVLRAGNMRILEAQITEHLFTSVIAAQDFLHNGHSCLEPKVTCQLVDSYLKKRLGEARSKVQEHNESDEKSRKAELKN